MQFRPLGEQAQHSSYPDLVSFRKQQAAGSQQDGTEIRRSTSLQDVSSLHSLSSLDSAFQSKKLKPILRGSDASAKSGAAREHPEKGAVKFGQKEVRLIRDPPLPPIEGTSKGALSLCDGSEARSGGWEDPNLSFGYSPPQLGHRRFGPERPPEIFPRGQPVAVKKPVTPTYDDYPEAYWELRSPTVQDPSDLKEDMIDRDRYRLQQISSLRLRAMNRELAASRLDCYRKWQQQMQDNSPRLGSSVTKQDSARGAVTSAAAAAACNGPARFGKQQRMSMSIQNHTLAVDAKSISPSTNQTGANKKRNKGGNTNSNSINNNNKKTDGSESAGQGNGSGNGHVTDDELRRREKIEAAARVSSEKQPQENEAAKPLKAAVVNLCMEPDRRSNSPSSDVYTGIRKVMLTSRPQSDKIRTQFFGLGYGPHQGPPGSVGAASNNATVGSPYSHHLQRIPSAPTVGTPPTPSVVLANGGDAAAASAVDGNAASTNGGKLILKKFNRLQVFGEKSAAVAELNTAASCSSANSPWDAVVPAGKTAASEKTPYLPQNRPPTYKLDMRNYPPRDYRRSSGQNGADALEGNAGIVESDGSYPLLGSERGGVSLIQHSPDRAEVTTSLSFRFRNGEVIVSRQGKKPSNQT